MYLVLLILLTIILVLKNKLQEDMTNDEVIMNLASIYNTDMLLLTNLNISDSLNVDGTINTKNVTINKNGISVGNIIQIDNSGNIKYKDDALLIDACGNITTAGSVMSNEFILTDNIGTTKAQITKNGINMQGKFILNGYDIRTNQVGCRIFDALDTYKYVWNPATRNKGLLRGFYSTSIVTADNYWDIGRVIVNPGFRVALRLKNRVSSDGFSYDTMKTSSGLFIENLTPKPMLLMFEGKNYHMPGDGYMYQYFVEDEKEMFLTHLEFTEYQKKKMCNITRNFPTDNLYKNIQGLIVDFCDELV